MTSGAWNPPASRASSSSRGGTSASASTSCVVSSRVAEEAALHDEVRVGPGEVAQRLRRRDRVAAVLAHERDRDRALEALDEVGEARVARGPAGERVLEDLVVGRRRVAARRAASRCSVTVRPRYSVSTAASAASSRCRISSMTVALRCSWALSASAFVGMSVLLGCSGETPRELRHAVSRPATLHGKRFRGHLVRRAGPITSCDRDRRSSAAGSEAVMRSSRRRS